MFERNFSCVHTLSNVIPFNISTQTFHLFCMFKEKECLFSSFSWRIINLWQNQPQSDSNVDTDRCLFCYSSPLFSTVRYSEQTAETFRVFRSHFVVVRF